MASGARCYVAPRLPHCAATCSCVCVQGAQHRGSAAYQARASPVRLSALQGWHNTAANELLCILHSEGIGDSASTVHCSLKSSDDPIVAD